MEEPTKSSSVPLFTWTPLWLYWPAYLALARCNIPNEYLTAQLSFRTGMPTDEVIRSEYYVAVKDKLDALAICEPMELNHPTNNSLIHRIPIAWRLPQWLYWKGEAVTLELIKTVHTLPENSTSGDYVRQVVQLLPAFKDRRLTFISTNGTIESDKAALALVEAGDGVGLASFTPWHQVEDLSAKDIRFISLPGPRREVTSLLYIDDKNGNMARLAQRFCTELKIVLTEMAETHGDRQLMQQFVSANNSFVNTFITEAGKIGVDDVKLLAAALAEYVIMGCYFPYSSIDAAMSVEIHRHLKHNLRSLSEAVVANVHTDIRSFLGVNAHWRDLSFVERVDAWSHFKRIHPEKETPSELWSHSKESALKLLARTVPVGRNRGYAAFADLAADLAPACPFGGDGVYLACDGVLRDENKSFQLACAPCILSGQPKGLASSAAQLLKKYALDKGGEVAKVSIRSKAEQLPKASAFRTYSGACPVAIWDLDPMLKTFAFECRASGGNNEECFISVYNGYDEVQQCGDVIVAINWTGSTKSGNSEGIDGQATDNLRAMAQVNEAAGRPVAWAGFWYNTDGCVKYEKLAGTKMHDQIPLFQSVWDVFKAKYNFAYVAVFSPEIQTP